MVQKSQMAGQSSEIQIQESIYIDEVSAASRVPQAQATEPRAPAISVLPFAANSSAPDGKAPEEESLVEVEMSKTLASAVNEESPTSKETEELKEAVLASLTQKEP